MVRKGDLIPDVVVRDDPVFQRRQLEPRGRGVLDSPPEPVIGLAEGETRWRGMTAGAYLRK
jgi:hypothetical protein